MESLTISDEVFDETHTYVGRDGEILSPPSPVINNKIGSKRTVKAHHRKNKTIESLTISEVFDEAHAYTRKNNGEHSSPRIPTISNQDINIIYDDDHAGGTISECTMPGISERVSTFGLKSIYLANGIHNHIEGNDLEVLPDRFQAGNTKARITWFGALCMAGIGMFVEAYIIITTGQVKLVWHATYPECWVPDEEQQCPQNIRCCGLFPNTPTNTNTGECLVNYTLSDHCNHTTGEYLDKFLCKDSVVGGVSYSEFAGIMVGMLVYGALADIIGVNAAGILTSILMIIGVSVMTFIKADSLELMFLIWIIFFGLFGLGVGGEYPLSASGAAEHHAKTMHQAVMDDEAQHRFRVIREKEKTARRGETIGMVFAMQGVGAVFGSLVLVILIYFSDSGRVECNWEQKAGTNSEGVIDLSTVWRSFYFIGLIFILMVFLYRWLIVEESKEGVEKVQKRKKTRGPAGQLTLGKIFGFYGVHLIATGGNWFLWDITFYGLKLFSGPIFEHINPGGDLIIQNGYLLVNNIIALAGYYICAMIIDNPKIGRKNVQLLFFILVSIVFLIMSFLFNNLSPGLLMTLYFMSSFLGQFVNTTTYVMAAETYPAELRGTLHGISAFLGKCGALLATTVFGTVSVEHIFLICGIAGLLGALLTVFFSADMTLVSLSEHDAKLELFLEGRLDEYKGMLNKPSHLSLFARLTRRHGEYDPDWAEKFVVKEKQSLVEYDAKETKKEPF